MARRFFAGLLVLALGVAALDAAEPFVGPRRVINGQTVDLAPLFRWWEAPGGGRPLTAWMRLNGHVVNASMWTWTVEATITKAPPVSNTNPTPAIVKVILKNPPKQQMDNFNYLVARRGELENRQQQLNAEVMEASNQVTAAMNSYKQSMGWKMDAAFAADRFYAAEQDQTQVKDELKRVENELQSVHTKLAAFPDQERYEFDIFALSTGQLQQGMPVFDMGVPLKLEPGK